MSIQSLRAFDQKIIAGAVALPDRAPAFGQHALAMAMLRDGVITAHDVVQALAHVRTGGGRLIDALITGNPRRETSIYAAMGTLLGLGVADLRQAPDPRLIDRLGAAFCMAHHILPWRDSGGTIIIAAAHPEVFQQHYAKLITVYGPVTHALAPQSQIETAILNARGPQLARNAETYLPLKDS